MPFTGLHRAFLKCVVASVLLTPGLPADSAEPGDILTRDFYSTAFNAHLNLEKFIPKGSVFFIGDSLINNLSVDKIHPKAVNFGVSGDTSVGILRRTIQYKSVQDAQAVVIEAGVNDLGFGRRFDRAIVNNYKKMMESLPANVPVFLIGVFPVDETVSREWAGYNARIESINAQITGVCKLFANCRRIDIALELSDEKGNLRKEYHEPTDGIHYNKSGGEVIVRLIRDVMQKHLDKAGWKK
jgi:lysophospholipase L1-like esterase